jgi:predicted aspartyl protease
MPTIVPLEIVAIEDDGFHLMVGITINGVDARMLVDTGASRSVFDQERIGRFFEDMPEMAKNEQKSTGLGTRDMQSQALYLDKVEIGELTIRKYPAVVLDMSHVNLSYAELGMDVIDGVLGSDILMKYGAHIEYGQRWLRINKRKKRLSVKKING